MLCKILEPSLVFLCFAYMDPQFLVRCFLSGLEQGFLKGFQSFSLDIGCFFIRWHLTLTYDSFKN